VFRSFGITVLRNTIQTPRIHSVTPQRRNTATP
jgi:hypothetical protein